MLQATVLTLLLTFLLDWIIGDPLWLPHPVVIMGKAISFLEKRLNDGSPEGRRRRGILLTVLVVGGSYFFTWTVLKGLSMISPYLRWLGEIFLIATTLAAKSLIQAGQGVLVPLQAGKFEEARKRLSWLVSRETDSLPEAEIVRGTVETLAENFVDGILSPLLFAAVGGAPLAMAFKAASTLDSMVGYRNEQYRDFGWFSARTDDWANYLPARVAVPILLVAGWMKNFPVRRGWRIWRRDAHRHPSPNGGNPESIVAGLLGIRLGGVNIYHGKPHHRAEMGDSLHPLTYTDITQCLALVRLATWLALIPGVGLAVLVKTVFKL